MLIHEESHTDHFPEPVIEIIKEKFSEKSNFFIESFELPPEFGTFPCHLHGPVTGEEAVSDAEAEMRPREGR